MVRSRSKIRVSGVEHWEAGQCMSPSWRVETSLQLGGDLAVFPFVCQHKSTRVDLG